MGAKQVGSRLVGEDALLYGERTGAEVVMSGVVRVTAARARQLLDQVRPSERWVYLAEVVVHVQREEREIARAS